MLTLAFIFLGGFLFVWYLSEEPTKTSILHSDGHLIEQIVSFCLGCVLKWEIGLSVCKIGNKMLFSI